MMAESSQSVAGVSQLPQPRAKWSMAEETTLVQAILDRESKLFGTMSGCGGVKLNTIKNRYWQEVVDVLNSQFFTIKRTLEQCRKKFNNLKSTVKTKVDDQKVTGGGPKVALTQSEQLLLDRFGERASVVGQATAVDTDAVGVCSDDPADQSILSEGSATASATADVPVCPNVTDFGASQHDDKKTCSSNSRNKAKRKYEVLTEAVLTIDQQRINLEMDLIRQRMEESQQRIKLMKKEEDKLSVEILMIEERRRMLEVKKELLSLKIKGITDFSFTTLT